MTGTGSHRWRVLHTGTNDAYWNMALDEVLLRAFAAGNSAPVFRVYEWKRPAITVGYSQRTADVIDQAACNVDSIEVTRRLTGGRAVFHNREIGYTVIGNIVDRFFGGSIRDTYRAINNVITTSYCSNGIDAKECPECNVSDLTAKLRHLAPCFAVPTPFELTMGGKKLAGGAQRRIGNSFLQQGTIRLGPGAERIADYITDRLLAAVFRQMLEPDTPVPDMNLSPQSMREALISSFSKAVDGAAYEDTLASHECKEVEHLSHTRYRAKGWIDGTGCEPDL